MVHTGSDLAATPIVESACTNKVVAVLNASAHDDVPMVRLPVFFFSMGSVALLHTNDKSAISVLTVHIV